jgi:hypothetical protein
MANFFTVQLDTTAPLISIYAPAYVDMNGQTEIRIVSNELLSSYQDIYIIDALGDKHNVIFSFDGNTEYTGMITFNNYAVGIATIHAELKDTVDNISNHATKTVRILATQDALRLQFTIVDISRNVLIFDSSRAITVSDISRSLSLDEIERKLALGDISRIVTTDEKSRNLELSDMEGR